MVNTSITLVEDTWTLIASNVDYLAQNRSAEKILVKAMGSEVAPTNVEGAFEIVSGELIGSTILNGYIYAMCPSKTVALVVAV